MRNEFTNKNQVGGIDRPPRPVTLGRRRSDRVLAYMTITLMIGMALFIIYTSYQQNRTASEAERSEQERALILERVECLAASTYAFEDAVGQYLASFPSNSDDPGVQQAREDLRLLQEFRRLNPPPEVSRCKTAPPR